jgi:hypothetical protein
MIQQMRLFFSNVQIAHLNFVIMDSKFRTIWSHHQNPALTLHFSLAAENFLKFIKPNANEAFWSNSLQVGALSADSHLFFSQLFTLQGESYYGVFDFPMFGLKPFPPFPLDLNKTPEQQSTTIQQIVSQFSSGNQCLETVIEQIQNIQTEMKHFSQLCLAAEKKFSFFSEREKLFSHQKTLIKEKFRENPVSSVNKQVMIDGTLIKLQLNVTEEQLVFDFSETQMKQNWGWPESMTNSFCYYMTRHFFPLRDANHSSFSFLKIIHSRQSPLAAKEFSFEKHQTALNEFFIFLQKSFEAISHRFVLKDQIIFERLGLKELEFLRHTERIRIRLKPLEPKSADRLRIVYRQKTLSLCDFKQLFPETTIALKYPKVEMTLPRDFKPIGHSEFWALEKNKHTYVMKLS